MAASVFEKTTDEDLQNHFVNQQFYQNLEKEENTDDYEDFTPNQMTVSLLDFQKYGLCWLMKWESHKLQTHSEKENYINPMWIEFQIDFSLYKSQEKSPQEIQRIKDNIKKQNNKNFENEWNLMNFYFNYLTGEVTLNFPYFDIQSSLMGGILADEMGLGKTL